MARNYTLTTKDNPWNPFTHPDEWRSWDEDDAKVWGRATCLSLLGTFAYTSEDLSDVDNEAAIDEAVNDIIEYDCLKIFTKVYEDQKMRGD